MQKNLFIVLFLTFSLQIQSSVSNNRSEALMRLRTAVVSNNINDISLVLEQFPDLINVKDKHQNTLLIYASADADPQTIKRLLAAKADINMKDGDGNTPLIVAVGNTKEENVRELLNGGANIDIKNRAGKTALQLAIENAQFEEVGPKYKARAANILKLLRQADKREPRKKKYSL